MTQQPEKRHFLDLTKDGPFKFFFSRSKPSLLSLLRTFLPLPEKKEVQNVEIVSDKKETRPPQPQSLTYQDSALYPYSIEGKQSLLDLNVQLNTGEKVDVEMQATNQANFSARSVFYWARLHATGLNRGEDYDRLHPTYSLIFTTFPLLRGENLDLVSPFSIRLDKPPHVALNRQLQMVFVDLSRFQKKSIEELVDLQDQWCYFLKESGRMSREQARLLSTKGEDMAKAVGLFDNASARDLEALRRRTEEREHWDRISMQAEARKKALKEGRAEGMQQGMQQGRAEGMQQEKQTVALNMLREKADMGFICKVTGLPEEEIKKLKNGS